MSRRKRRAWVLRSMGLGLRPDDFRVRVLAVDARAVRLCHVADVAENLPALRSTIRVRK